MSARGADPAPAGAPPPAAARPVSGALPPPGMRVVAVWRKLGGQAQPAVAARYLRHFLDWFRAISSARLDRKSVV